MALQSHPHRSEISVLSIDLSATIRFVDTADPEVVLRIMDELHALVGSTVGSDARVLDYVGDGVMLMFNDPVAVPDHELRAIRAAVDLRSGFRPLADEWERVFRFRTGMRIGINAGFATVSMIGIKGQQQYKALGRTVYLAALCDRKALDGQIVVTQRVAAAVENKVELEPLGPLSERLDRPVQAFNVVRLTDHGSQP